MINGLREGEGQAGPAELRCARCRRLCRPGRRELGGQRSSGQPATAPAPLQLLLSKGHSLYLNETHLFRRLPMTKAAQRRALRSPCADSPFC